MSDAERDEFLGAERTCRVATVGTGGPHVAPLWFVWHDAALWLTSLNRSQRWTDLERDPRIAVVVDAGHDYLELRGVELRGRVEAQDDACGPMPRKSRAGALSLSGSQARDLRAPEGPAVQAGRLDTRLPIIRRTARMRASWSRPWRAAYHGGAVGIAQ